MQYFERPERIIRLLEGNFFCESCAFASNTLTQMFSDWEIIAANKQIWEEQSNKEGIIKAKQLHVCAKKENGNGPKGPITQNFLSRMYYNSNSLAESNTLRAKLATAYKEYHK